MSKRREPGRLIARVPDAVRSIGERIFTGILDRPRGMIAALTLATIPLAGGMLLLQMRTDGSSVYPRQDPIVQQSIADRRDFHEFDQVIVVLAARPPARFDTPEGLRYIKGLHESLRTVPEVDPIRLRSLASLIDPEPGVALATAKPLLDTIPDDPEAFARLLARIRSSAVARGLLLSSDGDAAAMYVSTMGGPDRDGFVTRMEAWAHDHATTAYDVMLAGPMTVEVTFGRLVLSELKFMVPAMVLFIGLLLYLCFRAWVAVVVVLTKTAMALIWTLGVMGYCHVPVTLVTTILPVVLLTMGLTDEIYLLERVRRRFSEPVRPDPLGDERDPVRRAIKAGFAELVHPTLMTSLTTAAGFLSFVTASADPIRHFGIFTALGILIALALTFVLVPALLMVLPAGWLAAAPDHRSPSRGRATSGKALVLHDRLGALTGACLLLLVIPGLGWLSIQDSWIDNLDPRSRLVAADHLFNARFWGSYRFDVVLAGPRPLYFYESEGLRLIEKVAGVAAGAPHVGGVLTSLPAYEAAARSEGRTGAVYDLPPETLVGYTRLLQRASRQIDLDRVLNLDGSQVRIRLFVKEANYVRTREVETYLRGAVAPALTGIPVRYHCSGDLPSTQSALAAIVGNLLRSVGWTLVLVGALLVAAFRSLASALRALGPVCAGITMVLGGMGAARVPLGLATSMFVAVAVGVGVDFSIHFRHAYLRSRRTGADHPTALAEVMTGTGRALLWNTLVLSAGLLVLAFSALRPNRSLGVLLAATLAVCYATTLLFLPLLMRFERAGAGKEVVVDLAPDLRELGA